MRDKCNNKVIGKAGIPGVICCIGICLMAGCGRHDKALVIPVEQSVEENTAESLADNAKGYGADHMTENHADSGENIGQGGPQKKDVTDITESVADNTIYVYVCGAVLNPGMVELSPGSRAADALEAAGGFLENARRDVINLAQKVSDGEMLRFPSLDEAAEIGAELMGTQLSESSGKININTADVSQLTTLSGIGESRAKDIITYRNNNGNFTKIEDIMKVSGIKESIYNKIYEEITVE